MAFDQCSASAGADSGGGAPGAGRPAARLAAALALSVPGGSGVSGVSPDVQAVPRDVPRARDAVPVSAPHAGVRRGDQSGSASLHARPTLPIFAGAAFNHAPLSTPRPVKPVFAPQGAGASNYQNGLCGQLGRWYYLADYGKSFHPIISDAQYTLYQIKGIYHIYPDPPQCSTTSEPISQRRRRTWMNSSPCVCCSTSSLPVCRAKAWKSRMEPGSVAITLSNWPLTIFARAFFALSIGNGQLRPRASSSLSIFMFLPSAGRTRAAVPHSLRP